MSNRKMSDEKVNERIQRKNRRRFRSRVSPQQQKVAAITVALLAFIVLSSMIASPHNHVGSTVRDDLKASTYEEVRSQRYEKKAPATEMDYGTCQIRQGRVPDHPIQSTFTASYPGSGAKMTWKLIEAMTGIVTGDDHQLNGHSNIVSIKTHFPSSEGREIPGAENIPRAMLLIRNPLHSIPSYFNFIYEYQNNLPGHSTKAPLEEWIKWRNGNFDRQLQVWRRHTEYWMDKYDKLHRIVIKYENLIDDEKGPSEAAKIAEFLNRSDGVSTITPQEVPCVWYGLVKDKKRRRLEGVATDGTEVVPTQPDERQSKRGGPKYTAPYNTQPDERQSKRGGPKYTAPYNPQQLKDLIQILTQLLERYRDDKDLAPILVSYIDEAARRSNGENEDENTVVINS